MESATNIWHEYTIVTVTPYNHVASMNDADWRDAGREGGRERARKGET